MASTIEIMCLEMTMPCITTIVPDSFRGYIEPKGYYFENQEELLNLHFVKNFSVNLKGSSERYFHRFSLDGNTLMVETMGGKFSHAIATIDDVSNLTLPKWVDNEENTN